MFRGVLQVIVGEGIVCYKGIDSEKFQEIREGGDVFEEIISVFSKEVILNIC